MLGKKNQQEIKFNCLRKSNDKYAENNYDERNNNESGNGVSKKGIITITII